MVSSIQYSHIDSTRLMLSGKSFKFCVASQNQMLSLRHILVPLAILGPSSSLVVIRCPSSVSMIRGRSSACARSPRDCTESIRLV